MKRNIAKYVAYCPNCQQVKIDHKKAGGLLQNIEIPTWKWDTINMKFITGLLNSHRKFDSIWVIMGRREDESDSGSIVDHSESTKSYLDNWRRVLEFAVGNLVFLKVSPMKDVIRLEASLAQGDPSRTTPIEDVQVTEDLSYEEILVVILDLQVRTLQTKEVASVKGLWRNKIVEEITWKAEEDMKSRYPHLFLSAGLYRHIFCLGDNAETNMAGTTQSTVDDN
ncbi:PREDICTED: uncharacterized protein LOC109224324 [Nicotiana attenuata]|uniref:uncharacterized protein LOC109224324 n=1 Tax=Nicotiana attenuata TaxID=49451 RepID=UPI000905AF04|nr:PREDICTED: uncharacterized protein LOC109224324 [Nicotiana attenuata]